MSESTTKKPTDEVYEGKVKGEYSKKAGGRAKETKPRSRPATTPERRLPSTTGYSGLHNWNFDRDENNNFILWRGAERYNLTKDLSHFVLGQINELVTDDGPELVLLAIGKQRKFPSSEIKVHEKIEQTPLG